LLTGLAGRGALTPVEEVMERRFDMVAPSEMLEVALEKLQRGEGRALIVVRDEKVVGLVTPENIGEMLTIDRALRASRVRLG
jgi:CBS domain-containing protein